MKLGLLTALTEQECKLAARIGYDCLEARCDWSTEQLARQAARRKLADQAKALLDASGLSISALAVYQAGPLEAKAAVARFGAYVKMCGELGVGVITAMSGGDPAKGLDENLKAFQAVFSRVAPRAEDAGVRIAFENWPGLTGWFPPFGSTNVGFTPHVWERMFNLVDSEALGLEFDPSHLVWQGIDWAAALKRFASRIYHVHAKDTEVLEDRLAAEGFFSAGWWRYRLPGYGSVDWHEFTSLLKEHGYDGAICVEHEDPVFSGKRREEGLAKAHAFLRPLV